MSISFTGLIRAHGGSGGGQTTTWEPENTTMATTINTTWYPDETTWGTSYDTTWDPDGTMVDTTWDPGNTTIPNTTVTTEMTTAEPSKPRRRLFYVRVFVEGYDTENGLPIFTLSANDAMLHTSLATPPVPMITGSPAADGSMGDLKAGGIAFDDDSTQEENINTTETHTKIETEKNHAILNPNPRFTPGKIDTENEEGFPRYKIYFDVQIAYIWLYSFDDEP